MSKVKEIIDSIVMQEKKVIGSTTIFNRYDKDGNLVNYENTAGFED